MNFITRALRVGASAEYFNPTAAVRSRHDTAHPHHHGTLGQNVGSWWHLVPQKDFVSLGPTHKDLAPKALTKIGEGILRFVKRKPNHGDA